MKIAAAPHTEIRDLSLRHAQIPDAAAIPTTIVIAISSGVKCPLVSTLALPSAAPGVLIAWRESIIASGSGWHTLRGLRKFP
ncbi:MAG: hypothetical protein JO099_17060 [Acidobacteriia bacterium]|nr:hypothetical protein [Terriglobia bacterium]